MKIKPPDPSRLAAQLSEILAADLSSQEKIDSVLQLTVSIVNGAGALFYREQQGQLRPVGQLLSRQTASMSEDLQAELLEDARAALQEKKASVTSLSLMPSAYIISCPLSGISGLPNSCLSVLVLLGDSPREPFLIILQLLASTMAHLGVDEDKKPALQKSGLLSALAGIEDKLEYGKLIETLREWLGCNLVAVGYGQPGGNVRLKSISDVVKVDARTRQARLFVNVMQDCLQQDTLTSWPAITKISADESLVMKGLVLANNMKAGVAALLPGASGKSTILVFLWADARASEERVKEFTQTAPLIGLMLEALGSTDNVPHHAHPKSGKPAIKKIAAVSLLAALLAGFSLYPVTYNIHAACLVAPVKIRYIVSQFDGFLKDVFVEPGDKIKRQDPMASLDGRELELELRSIEADSSKALKLRDNHLASGNTAAAQIGLLEYQRLQERAQLLLNRQKQLHFTSPVDGIVLSGELRREVGGPVTKGQVLFEVAPLETILIEIAIGDDDISHVEEQAPVTAHFNAFPSRSWQGTISHIAPKSELVQGQNSFIVSLQIANTENLLQPGMQGQASIEAGRKSLVWIYFHKPWHALVRLLRSLV